jgi:hypothetical protein
MISLEHVRALLADLPKVVVGRRSVFCDFAGPGDQSVLAVCEDNSVRIVDAWVHRDTMVSVGRFINWFKKLGLRGWQIGGEPDHLQDGCRTMRRRCSIPVSHGQVWTELPRVNQCAGRASQRLAATALFEPGR